VSENLPGYLDGKSREELLALLANGMQPGSVLALQADAALRVKIAEHAEREMRNLGLAVGQAAGAVEKVGRGLEQAIRDAASASDRLGRKLFWLNVVLAAATVVGAFAAVWAAFN
jgi:hypothetical protein